MDSLFFVLSKLVWILIQPDSLLAILIGMSTGFIYWGKTRAVKRTLTPVLFGILAVGLYPIGDFVIAPLEQSLLSTDDRHPSHIVILGGAEDSFSSNYNANQNLNDAGERVLFGVAAAKKYPDAKIVLTGGSGNLLDQTISGARIMEPMLLDLGIHPDRIIIEDTSRNTFENAINTAKTVGLTDTPTILLVTSAYHMPRSVGVFCKAGFRNIIPHRVDYRASFRATWDLSGHLFDLKIGIREWVGLGAYYLTGKIDTLIPQGC